MAAVMDDRYLYTLSSLVPAASIIGTSGDSFSISSATDPNQFYWNTAFTGSLMKPTLNDIIRIEQLWNKQNFELAGERSSIVLDSTMDSLISQDKETKSLLTRWINDDGADLVKYKHTVLHQRSRVALYDPAGALMKDYAGTVPATTVSAAISFIASQLIIGVGLFDVFMIQDTANYGYKMSCNFRGGIKPLRANYDGLGALVFQAPAAQ
jgi:hypothetical protein